MNHLGIHQQFFLELACSPPPKKKASDRCSSRKNQMNVAVRKMSITCFKNQFNGFGHRNLRPSFRGCLMQIHQGTPLCHRSTFSLCIFQCHPVEATGLLRVVSHKCVDFRKELTRSYPLIHDHMFHTFHKNFLVYLSPSLPIAITSKLRFVSRGVSTSLRAFFSALGASKAFDPGRKSNKDSTQGHQVLEAMFENIANGTPSLWPVPCFNSCQLGGPCGPAPLFSTCRRTLENHVIQVLTTKNICPLKRSSATYNQMKFHLASFQS